jgi:hypothetical protein
MWYFKRDAQPRYGTAFRPFGVRLEINRPTEAKKSSDSSVNRAHEGEIWYRIPDSNR